MSSPAPAKVCTRCGQDCAGKPRVKDQRGRYTCQPCYDQLKAERTAPSPFPTPPTPAAPEPAAASEPEGFDVFALEPSAEEPKTAPCRNCGAPLADSAVLCVSCGFNKKLGRTARESDVAAALPPPSPTAPQRARRTKCGKCGYDLRGITAPTCPECGASAMAPTRRERDMENAAEVRRQTYVQPAIMLAIGFVLSSIVYAMLFQQQGLSASMGALFYLINLAISVPIGVLVFWICCLLWLGFDAPLHLTALRLAAIYSVTDIVQGLFAFVPLPWWAEWGVIGSVYVGLLMHFLELAGR